MGARNAGGLLIPLLASLYAAYMLYEQFSGSYRDSTKNYALLTGGCVLLFAFIVLMQEITAAKSQPVERQSAQPSRDHLHRIIRGCAVFALACLLVYLFEWVGYLVGFFAFAALSLVILRVRSPLLLFAVPVGTVLIVHFVFVGWFGLPLPAGLLRGVV